MRRIVIIASIGLSLTACMSTPAAGSPDEGAALFEDYCTPCHGENGGGNESIAAPSIANLPAWYVAAEVRKFREGARGMHFDDIEGLRMRPMAMALETEGQIAAVSGYVAALPAARPAPTMDGDAAKGKASFATCTACHQADASGMEAMSAPPLTKQPDWYLARQIHKFKDGVRGSNPLDKTGATMAPMARTLADDEAIRNVVAIQTLGK
jgi:cytochrome c553